MVTRTGFLLFVWRIFFTENFFFTRISTGELPIRISKSLGSTVQFMFLSNKAKSSGWSVKFIVCFSPGFKLIRSKPLNCISYVVTLLTRLRAWTKSSFIFFDYWIYFLAISSLFFFHCFGALPSIFTIFGINFPTISTMLTIDLPDTYCTTFFFLYF